MFQLPEGKLRERSNIFSDGSLPNYLSEDLLFALKSFRLFLLISESENIQHYIPAHLGKTLNKYLHVETFLLKNSLISGNIKVVLQPLGEWFDSRLIT